LKIAITAFGGPQMHFTQFHQVLVKQRNYISEEELKELNSLCSMLPGPTSTQTITAIGYKIGGPLLAFITLGIWVLPASLIMTAFAITLSVLTINNPKIEFLKYIQPMAVGFIVFAAYRITQLFITSSLHWVLMFASAGLAIYLDTPYLFPILLLAGGVITARAKRAEYKGIKPIKNINWSNFILFLGVFLTAALVGYLTKSKEVLLFENTYRFGSLVFGGGHVLIPMMYNQFVVFKHYIEAQDFLAGVGILQAIPGPVFSISTFTGAMAFQASGVSTMILGAVIGTIAIFLPGILLIFFIYPIWAQVKVYEPIKAAIEGINATSAGLVLASAYILFKPVEVNEPNMLILLGTLFLLLSTKLPNPLIVVLCIVAGFLF
jgi:chromate transporter